MRRIALLVTVIAMFATAVAGSTATVFPGTIALPNGWRPEGIATTGLTFYVGSLANGGVYKGSLITGEGDVLVPAQPGRVAVGVDYDRGRLFVAGGPTGAGYVYDAKTGAGLASYQFTTESTFVNDVVVTRNAAWFTDSRRPVLYRVPLGPGGSPGEPAQVLSVPLSGEFTFVPGQTNANGIDATWDGKTLVVVNTFVGTLYTVDPDTGVADEIELTGGDALNGDGILLDFRRLYVVKNFQNRIAVVDLESNLESGKVVRHIGPAGFGFDIPTTIDDFAFLWMYAVNARFSTPPTPDTTYTIVRVPKFGG